MLAYLLIQKLHILTFFLLQAGPLARGKGSDRLELRELSAAPLLDVVLRPGETRGVRWGWRASVAWRTHATEAELANGSLLVAFGSV